MYKKYFLLFKVLTGNLLRNKTDYFAIICLVFIDRKNDQKCDINNFDLLEHNDNLGSVSIIIIIINIYTYVPMYI